jgi:hypothetical protein
MKTANKIRRIFGGQGSDTGGPKYMVTQTGFPSVPVENTASCFFFIDRFQPLDSSPFSVDPVHSLPVGFSISEVRLNGSLFEVDFFVNNTAAKKANTIQLVMNLGGELVQFDAVVTVTP